MAHGVILGQKQNTDELLPRDGPRAMEANLNVGNHKVINVANGTNGTDAVNLNQTNSLISSATVDFVTEDDVNEIINSSSVSNTFIENFGPLETAFLPLAETSRVVDDINTGNSFCVACNPSGYTYIIPTGTTSNISALNPPIIFRGYSSGTSSFSKYTSNVFCYMVYYNGRYIASVLDNDETRPVFAYTIGTSFSTTRASGSADYSGTYGCVIGYNDVGLYAICRYGVNNNYATYYSTNNGSNWYSGADITFPSSTVVMYDVLCSEDTNMCFIATNSGLYSLGSDITNLTVTREISDDIRSIKYFKGYYFAVTGDGNIYRSSNGTSWSNITFSSTLNQNGVGETQGVAVTDDFIILMGRGYSVLSYNGTTWYTSPACFSIYETTSGSMYQEVIFHNNNNLVISNVSRYEGAGGDPYNNQYRINTFVTNNSLSVTDKMMLLVYALNASSTKLRANLTD